MNSSSASSAPMKWPRAGAAEMSAQSDEAAMIDLVVEAGAWTDEAVAAVERAALAALQGRKATVSIMLTDDATIRVLNQQFRGKDKATNVLSFPAAKMPGNEEFLGDIAIAQETAEREAAEEGKALIAHLSHLAVHGVLHLLGEDHETPEEAERMEAAERAILAVLGIADPYRDTIPADG